MNISCSFLFPLLFFSILFSSFIFAQEVITHEKQVYFESDQFQLSEKTTAALDELVKELDKPLLYKINITGETDSAGSNSYNKQLSKNRAMAVADYFKSQGVVPNSIEVAYNGEKLADAQSESAMKGDRKVQIKIEQTDVLGGSKPATQTATINPNRSNTILGKNGTLIVIPAHTLVLENNNPVFGEVEIELQEFFTKSEFVMNQLHTSSEGGLLESGGMIYINATSNGREVKVKNGKKVTIKLPAEELKNDMLVFNTEVDETTEELGLWIPGDSIKTEDFKLDLAVADSILSLASRNSVDKDLRTKYIQFLGDPGNEEELGIILGNAIRAKDPVRIDNLVHLFDVDFLMGATSSDDEYVQKSMSVPIYKKKTQRQVRLTDESFDGYEFDRTSRVFYERNRDEHNIDLMEADDSFEGPLSVQQYIMQTAKLGWINCDRFRESNNLTNFVAYFDPQNYASLQISLVFEDINSVLGGHMRSDGKVTFDRVPQGEKALLFAYQIKDNKLMTSIKEVSIGTGTHRIDLQETTKEDLQSIFEQMNGETATSMLFEE